MCDYVALIFLFCYKIFQFLCFTLVGAHQHVVIIHMHNRHGQYFQEKLCASAGNYSDNKIRGATLNPMKCTI